MLAALIGGVLTALTWFLGGQIHPWLSGMGTALMIATIPLLIFSGYCLDWSDPGEVSEKEVGRREIPKGTKQNGLVRD